MRAGSQVGRYGSPVGPEESRLSISFSRILDPYVSEEQEGGASTGQTDNEGI